MGKVTATLALGGLAGTVTVEGLVDTGATLLCLPEEVVAQVGLERLREARVRYADNRMERRAVFGPVRVELQGRLGYFNAMELAAGMMRTLHGLAPQVPSMTAASIAAFLTQLGEWLNAQGWEASRPYTSDEIKQMLLVNEMA